MSSRGHKFAAMVMGVALSCGCAQSQRQAVDDAYYRGYISSAERQRHIDELSAKQEAASEAARQQDGQQLEYSNSRSDKLVRPQPTEDPIHAGRPIDEMSN